MVSGFWEFFCISTDFFEVSEYHCAATFGGAFPAEAISTFFFERGEYSAEEGLSVDCDVVTYIFHRHR